MASKQKETTNCIYNVELIRFNEPDAEGNVIKKGAINIGNFKQMRKNGKIINYNINDIGIEISIPTQNKP